MFMVELMKNSTLANTVSIPSPQHSPYPVWDPEPATPWQTGDIVRYEHSEPFPDGNVALWRAAKDIVSRPDARLPENSEGDWVFYGYDNTIKWFSQSPNDALIYTTDVFVHLVPGDYDTMMIHGAMAGQVNILYMDESGAALENSENVGNIVKTSHTYGYQYYARDFWFEINIPTGCTLIRVEIIRAGSNPVRIGKINLGKKYYIGPAIMSNKVKNSAYGTGDVSVDTFGNTTVTPGVSAKLLSFFVEVDTRDYDFVDHVLNKNMKKIICVVISDDEDTQLSSLMAYCTYDVYNLVWSAGTSQLDLNVKGVL